MRHSDQGTQDPPIRVVRSPADPAWLRLPEHLGISVRLGTVPDHLPGAEVPWPWIEVTSTEALVRFSEVASIWVRGGSEVVVQWHADPDLEGDPSWMLQGWAVTLAALQRGDLSLHAATVRIGDRVVAIAGHRGAGKSTTAMGLRGRGHQLLTDDVALLEFRGDEAWTTPYARNVHLLPDAAEALGFDFDRLPLLAGGRTKAAFAPDVPPLEPHRIDLLVVLAPGEEGASDQLRVTEAVGGQRLNELVGHTSRDGLSQLVLGYGTYFAQLARLAGSAPVFVISRPEGDWTLERVLDAIEELAQRCR